MRLAIELYLRTGLRSSELQYLTNDAVNAQGPSGERGLLISNRKELVKVKVPMSLQQFDDCRSGSRLRYRILPSEVIDTPTSKWSYNHDQQALIADITVTWRPKTNSRSIPMTSKLCELIDTIQEERKRVWSLIRSKKPNTVIAPSAPWLIPDVSGLPWRWKMPFIMDSLSERCGIQPVIRTHDLRHTFATRLRKAGVALETIKELLGHADIQETMVYAHYQESEGLSALQKID